MCYIYEKLVSCSTYSSNGNMEDLDNKASRRNLPHVLGRYDDRKPSSFILNASSND